MYIVDRPEAVMVRGDGSYLYDHTGKRYLDFVQGWAVNSLGHCPAPAVEAITRQAQTLINPSPAFFNRPMIDLADAIVGKSCFDRVFFANSGAEANEGAVKLARKWGALNKNGAYEIVTMNHSFHGRTLAMMSASGKDGWDRLFEPKVPGFRKIDLNDLDALTATITDKTVAVMLEPIQGEAGVFPAQEGYMRKLRALCDEKDILLIVDEVQTGVGRTGKLFGYELFGIEPDIMTLGKGLGGGVPIAALVAKERVSCFVAGDQGGTFNGNPLMCAAALAVFTEIGRPEFLQAVENSGRYLRLKLEELANLHGFGEVRGQGLLRALNLKRPVGKTVAEYAFREGMLINSPRPDTLRFMPALNVSRDEINEMTVILDRVFSEVARA